MKHRLRRQDILTPPNALSMFGFLLVLIGCTRLDSWQGLGFVTIGRLMDVADGWLARRYSQTSRFGAALDASLDKLALLAIMIATVNSGIVHTAVVLAISLQNIVSVLLTWLADRRYPDRQLTPSRAGKYAMAFQNLALGAFIIGNLLSPAFNLAQNEIPTTSAARLVWANGFELAGTIFLILGVFVFGLWAVVDYAKRLRH